MLISVVDSQGRTLVKGVTSLDVQKLLIKVVEGNLWRCRKVGYESRTKKTYWERLGCEQCEEELGQEEICDFGKNNVGE
jgi:hypothetical protein